MIYNNPFSELFIESYKYLIEFNYESIWQLLIQFPKNYDIWWWNLLKESPQHVLIETALIIFIIWLLFIKRTVDPQKSSKIEKLSSKEIDWLIETWNPEPLAPTLSRIEEKMISNSHIIEKIDKTTIAVKGFDETITNFGSFDFFGLSLDPKIKQRAHEALEFYGCGSCGPRGFYGTIDQHLFFEEEMAKHMGTEEAISYSDSASVVYSAIPAFSKKGDLLIVDDACSEAVLTGCNLSRSSIRYFKHNDLSDLRSILESIAEEDRRLNRDTYQQRRFIVVEGLYKNTGDICPLPDLIDIKEKYFYRLILDESLSFGILGKTGKGLTEFYGININNVEVITLAMDTVLGSVGGVCVGAREIVDHQRLSGAGYCFSASSPPFISAVAIESLKRLQNETTLFEKLQKKISYFHNAAQNLNGFKVISDPMSPVIHITLEKRLETLEKEGELLLDISNYCFSHGVGINVSKFSVTRLSSELPPSLMICINIHHTKKSIEYAVSILNKGFAECN